jgi:hypothetical protein
MLVRWNLTVCSVGEQVGSTRFRVAQHYAQGRGSRILSRKPESAGPSTARCVTPVLNQPGRAPVAWRPLGGERGSAQADARRANATTDTSGSLLVERGGRADVRTSAVSPPLPQHGRPRVKPGLPPTGRRKLRASRSPANRASSRVACRGVVPHLAKCDADTTGQTAARLRSIAVPGCPHLHLHKSIDFSHHLPNRSGRSTTRFEGEPGDVDRPVGRTARSVLGLRLSRIRARRNWGSRRPTPAARQTQDHRSYTPASPARRARSSNGTRHSARRSLARSAGRFCPLSRPPSSTKRWALPAAVSTGSLVVTRTRERRSTTDMVDSDLSLSLDT